MLIIEEVEIKLEGMISLLLEIVKSGIQRSVSPTCSFLYSIYAQSAIIFQLRPSHLEFWIPRRDRDIVEKRFCWVLRKISFSPQLGLCFHNS